MRAWLMVLTISGCATGAAERRAAERVVLRSLESADAGERAEATRVAVEVADPLLDQQLAPRLGDPDALVRALAAAALASQVEPAREVLRAALAGPDAAATIAALDGVGALDDGAQLAAKLCEDEDEAVRARAAWALASLDKKRARDVLQKLAADPRPGVRAEALRAIASLGDRELLPLVERALGDPALPARLAAISTLARLERSDRPLLAASSGPDALVALRAAVQLSRRGTLSLAAVEKAAADRRAEVRAAAMNAAGELGRPAIGIAEARLRDPDLEVRLAAARALVSAGGSVEKARPILRAALSTPRALEAAFDLARLGDGRTALENFARSKDAGERRAAVSMLASLAPTSVVHGLDDGDARVRLIAARAILRRALRPYLR